MKVLIVGGAGYIGGYLTDYFLNQGVNVTVYDSLLYEYRYFKDVEFIRGDIHDFNKLSLLLKKFDVVIWLAAIVGDGACAINPVVSKQLNEETVKWLSDNYDGKIMFTSTCSVYGKNDDLLDESAPTNPLSIYASTKLAAEQYIVKTHKNYLIYRLGTLFGIGDKHSRIRFDLVANVLTKKATLGEELTVFGGDQWRPLLHVKDVAHAFYFGLINDINGLYNLHRENVTIRSVAECIKTIIPTASINYQTMQFEDARNYKVSSDKIRKYGWLPKISIEEGIIELNKIIIEGRVKNVNDSIYSNEAYLKE